MTYAIVDAAELFGSGPEGGLRFRVFPRGAMVLTSDLFAEVPTEYRFGTDPNGIHISAQYFLSGEASILMGDGSVGFWSENGMSIIRSDSPGFRLRVEAGQTLRHVCVAMYDHDLGAVQADSTNPQMGRLLGKGVTVDMAVPMPAGPGTRSKAVRLHELIHQTGIQGLKAEAAAMDFLADALEQFSGLQTDGEMPGRPAPWQRVAARQIRQAIDADPLQPMTMDALFSQFGMGEAMASRIFRAEFGVTINGYIRRARLVWAQHALQDNQSVKSIALSCGYTHIGNFTRAYRQEFGESPSETRRRTRTG